MRILNINSKSNKLDAKIALIKKAAQLRAALNLLDANYDKSTQLFQKDIENWFNNNLIQKANKAGVTVYKGSKNPTKLIKPYLILPYVSANRDVEEAHISINTLQFIKDGVNYELYSKDNLYKTLPYAELITAAGQQFIDNIYKKIVVK